MTGLFFVTLDLHKLMCYVNCMNTRYGGRECPIPQRNNRKTIKTSPVKVFVLTLLGVLLIGSIVIVCISLPKYIKTHGSEGLNIVAYVEAIPETLTAENPEVLGANTPREKYADLLSDSERMKAEHVFKKKAASKDVVTLGFTGDILFDDEYAVMASIKQKGGAIETSIGPELISLMQSRDIMVVNNEFPYTERGTRTPEKTYTFRADYATAGYLNTLGVDAAILANNHVLDFGQVGLDDTLTTLTSVGVVPMGAGHNIEEASRVTYFVANDIKIGIVAATQIERNDRPDTIGATETSGGTFRCWTGDLIYQKIAEAKANADFVIVCVHWGTEKENQPDYYQTTQGPLLAAAGADLIVGDHPHILQGFTYFGDTPCIYSMGNFLFNSATIDTGILNVSIDKNGLKSLQFIPAVQSKMTTTMAIGKDYSRIINSMRKLSPGVTIDDDGFVYKNF